MTKFSMVVKLLVPAHISLFIFEVSEAGPIYAHVFLHLSARGCSLATEASLVMWVIQKCYRVSA